MACKQHFKISLFIGKKLTLDPASICSYHSLAAATHLSTFPIDFHDFSLPIRLFFVTIRLFPCWSDLLILHHLGLRHGGPAPSRVPQDVPLWQTDGLLVSWLLALN